MIRPAITKPVIVILDTARANGAELVIIDTPPSAEAIALQAAKVSDFILIPTRATVAVVKTEEHGLDRRGQGSARKD
jgi:hypothetical protein